MTFDCEKCGKIEEALMDGYAFGDRVLEGVQFRVRKADDGTCTVTVDPNSEQYFSKLNQKHWLKRAKEFAEQNDMFECPECGEDVVPDDML